MESRWQYEAMGRGESREELEGLIDDIDEEEWEIARRYHPGRPCLLGEAIRGEDTTMTQVGSREMH
jgi:hypothetical protein